MCSRGHTRAHIHTPVHHHMCTHVNTEGPVPVCCHTCTHVHACAHTAPPQGLSWQKPEGRGRPGAHRQPLEVKCPGPMGTAPWPCIEHRPWHVPPGEADFLRLLLWIGPWKCSRMGCLWAPRTEAPPHQVPPRGLACLVLPQPHPPWARRRGLRKRPSELQAPLTFNFREPTSSSSSFSCDVATAPNQAAWTAQ